MAVNKVMYGGKTVMDITDSTVTADKLAKGVTAYDKSGAKITGTMTAGTTPTGTLSITANGTYDVTQYANANVHVPSSGGGGSSMETCTVEIAVMVDAFGSCATGVYYYTMENGSLKSTYVSIEDFTDGGYTGANYDTKTIEVVVGFEILVEDGEFQMASVSTSGDITVEENKFMVPMYVFKANSSRNGSIKIG